ncbi:MAG: cytochrome c peroxidase [Planctomycetota bacterium]|jgi:cytochrome c peroxidase
MTLIAKCSPLPLIIAIFTSDARAQLPPPPAPPENPITQSKAVLGKMLFWDEQLSADNTIACGTCHIPSSGGADPRTGTPASLNPGLDAIFGTADDLFGTIGVSRADEDDQFSASDNFGFGAQVTDRQSPSTIGAQYFEELFWDGRASSTFLNPETGAISILSGGALESQAAGPPVSDVEMAHESRDWSQITAKLSNAQPLKLASNLTPDIVAALNLNPSYPELFQEAFGTQNITAERIAFAIATYERTLVPDQTRFDTGNLTPTQQQGLNIFNGPGASCSTCHQAPLFSDGTYRNIGVRPPLEDFGRQVVTGNNADRGRFKVPSLRNVGLRNTFFHNGMVPAAGPPAPANSLEAVIAFYARGGDFPQNQSPILNNINIPPQAAPALVEFLRNGLTDPRVANELPPFDRPNLNSENPAPNPRIFGAGSPGSAGFIPEMLAVSPPSVGTPGFKVGVAGARGGAIAHLMYVARPQVTVQPGGFNNITPVRLSPLASIVLDGTGPGAGFGTVHVSLEDIPALLQPDVTLQWIISDRGAPGGIATSQRVELSLIY